jgi:NAD(P)-dependent dehydrogenase (short-subunit alcohol dehydrogenase family)
MDPRNNSSKTAAITGATGAIGEAIATQLALLHYKVILITRNPEKTEAVIKRISAKTKNLDLSYQIADLSREADVKAIADQWRGELHILINNAAAVPVQRLETPEGIEMQFATNVLGYFWMTRYISPVIADSGGGRIINVASYWSGSFDITDLEFKARAYNNHDAYRQSKQANRMLTPVFANQLFSSNITVNACHPGDVNSTLSNDLGFGGSQSPTEGARTPVWLAVADELSDTTGKYFEDRKEVNCQYASLKSLSEELYIRCNSYTQ